MFVGVCVFVRARACVLMCVYACMHACADVGPWASGSAGAHAFICAHTGALLTRFGAVSCTSCAASAHTVLNFTYAEALRQPHPPTPPLLNGPLLALTDVCPGLLHFHAWHTQGRVRICLPACLSHLRMRPMCRVHPLGPPLSHNLPPWTAHPHPHPQVPAHIRMRGETRKAACRAERIQLIGSSSGVGLQGCCCMGCGCEQASMRGLAHRLQ